MLLLALVWLSLTTYAWEDYDSICGSFYIGISYLNMILEDCEGKTNEKYFDKTISVLQKSLDSIDISQFEKLVVESEIALKSGHKIVVSGLGKNVPICEKFVGSMLSMGLTPIFYTQIQPCMVIWEW